jgi:hypothetical protein
MPGRNRILLVSRKNFSNLALRQTKERCFQQNNYQKINSFTKVAEDQLIAINYTTGYYRFLK